MMEPVAIRWNDAGRTGDLPLASGPENPHLWLGFQPDLPIGAFYQILLADRALVDPYARSLPHGVHGLAQVVAPPPRGQHPKRRIDLARGEVFYELHIGTFTPEGTFRSAATRLGQLAELGVTVIEIMPVAAFAGSRGWGYDSVALLAPFAPYGTALDLAQFIDSAHGLGMSVILDVVYNHLGPDGNYLPAFSESYFDSGRDNAWGKAPAFDKYAFRKLVVDSARYWLEDIGFDGLRLDAVHELEPGGHPHILEHLSAMARSCNPPAFLVAEDDRNDPAALFARGIDAVWSDDFHHSVHVLLTSERDGYYSGYQGTLAELARIIERGHLYEGQVFPPTGKPRGKPAPDLPRERFVYALQNHDQVGNRAQGERLHSLCNERQVRAVTLLLLFLPATPLLFMGQESMEDEPFLYFTDHTGELGAAVTSGRREEFAGFAGFGAGNCKVPDPQDEATLLQSQLHWRVGAKTENALDFHRRALQLRREDAALRGERRIRCGVEESVLWVCSRSGAGTRLLLFNIGGAVTLKGVPGINPAGSRLLLASENTPHDGSSFELPAEASAVYEVSAASEEG
jgi:maltooligosyltrehalose trehalohydrolase